MIEHVLAVIIMLNYLINDIGAFSVASNSRIHGSLFSPQLMASRSIFGNPNVFCRDLSVEAPKSFRFIASYNDTVHIPSFSAPEIAFIGKSNVGKSSLINSLTGLHKNLAVVSKIPGRTRKINLFECREKSNNKEYCIFVDLPGYGFASINKREKDVISLFLRQYLQERLALRLIFLLIDIRRDGISEEDSKTITFLNEEGLDYVLLLTKCDKETAREIQQKKEYFQNMLEIPQDAVIACSSISGAGKREVWNSIRAGIMGKLSVQQ